MIKSLVTIGTALALGFALMPAQTQRAADEAHTFLVLKERWAIKTGADPVAERLRISPSQTTTVANLLQKERPKELPETTLSRDAQTNRYGDTEQTVFTIDADILRYKVDPSDHEISIVIRDHGDAKAEDAPAESGQRRTMTVEIPDPIDVVQSSPWRSQIVSAHRDFTRVAHPVQNVTDRVMHAKITGVGYFDYLHGQSGGAPNGMELHPVLKLEFLDKTIAVAPIPDMANQQTAVRPSKEVKTSVRPSGEVKTGQVWANPTSHFFWRSGSRFYGKTKRGKYMTEEEAVKAGYRAGVEP